MLRTLVTPRWLLALLVAIAFAVACVFLGRWQWHKYEAKSAAATTVHLNYGATPVPLTTLESRLPLGPAGEWTRVTARGTYAAGQQVLVRNRVLEGDPGLEVLVPFTLIGADGSPQPTRLLVDRGWVQNADTAAQLPDVPAAPGGTVTLQGWLRTPEVDLGRFLPQGQLSSINIPTAEQQVGGQLLDTYLLLETEHTAGGAVPPRPRALDAPDTDLGPNQAYAFQWWLFAVFGFVFYGYRIRVLQQDRAYAASLAALPEGTEDTDGPGDGRLGDAPDRASDSPLDGTRGTRGTRGTGGADTHEEHVLVGSERLVGAGAAGGGAARPGRVAKPPRPKKVRIWDEEDG